METFVLLVLFVLIAAGAFWIIRKSESLNHEDCNEDCSSHAPYKIEPPESQNQITAGPVLVDPQKQVAVQTKDIGQESRVRKPRAPRPSAAAPKAAPAAKAAPKAVALKVAPKAAPKQTKNVPVPAKQPARAPRAKKSNN